MSDRSGIPIDELDDASSADQDGLDEGRATLSADLEWTAHAAPNFADRYAPVPSENEDGLWSRLGAIVLAIMAAGFVFRIAQLGARPLHHDESLDAWFSWKALNGTYDGYDPVYHGPLRFYMTSVLYFLFGESIAVTRLLSVLAGTVVIGLPWFWRRSLGNVATVAAAVIVAVSPSMLYFSRMGREDSLWLALTAGSIFTLVGLVRRPRWWHPVMFFVLFVAAWAVKESTLLSVFLIGAIGLAVLGQQVLFHAPAGQRALVPEAMRPRVARASMAGGLVLMILAFFLAGNQHAFRNLALYGATLAFPLFAGLAAVRMGPDRLRQDPALMRAAKALAMVLAAVAAVLTALIVVNFALYLITWGDTSSIGLHGGTKTAIRVVGHVLFGLLTAGAVVSLFALIWTFVAPANSGGAAHTRLDEIPILGRLARPGSVTWAAALLTGVVFFVAIFSKMFSDWVGATTEFTEYNSVVDGLRSGYDYWMGEQQDSAPRGDNRWQYYLAVIPGYEWLFLGLAAVGSTRVFRRPTLMHQVIFWWGLGSFIVHSWAKERMPWLIIHPLFPLLILAGIGVSVLWDRRQKAWLPPVAAVGMVALVFTVYTSYQASYVRGAEQRELFVQAAQATEDVPEWIERLNTLNQLSTSTLGRPIRVAIGDEIYWPYGYYLRDEEWDFFAVYNGESARPEADVWILAGCDATGCDVPLLEADLTASGIAFQSFPYDHRWWWVPDYSDAGVSGWFNWVLKREIWDEGVPPGSQVGDGSLSGSVIMTEEMVQLEARLGT